MTHLTTSHSPRPKPSLPQARIIDERKEGMYTRFTVQLPSGQQIVLRSSGWYTAHRGRTRHATEVREFWLWLDGNNRGSKARADIFKTGLGFRLDLRAGVMEYSSLTRAIEQLALDWAGQFPGALDLEGDVA